MIDVRSVADEGELEQILDLQRRNLPRNLTAREMAENGFVTVEHTLDVLRRMHALVPSIVAKDGAELAGYALVMPVECRSFVPVLEPMFQRLEMLGMFRQRFYVMGQICVAAPYRGRGVFDLLYRTHRDELRGQFDCVVTEVSVRNTRSLRAHQRVGFTELERYRDATDEWVLLAWRW
jgi:ribosomal protein S18 acetylase RimI-like enzyme